MLKGDLVLISGEATGYGILEGYINRLSKNLSGDVIAEVIYTPESRNKANGRLGTVCPACFCEPKKKNKDEELRKLLDLSDECRTQMDSIFIRHRMTTPELNKLPNEAREEWLKLREVFKGISDDICKLINN